MTMTGAVVIGRSHSAAIAEALATVREAVSDVRVYRLEDAKRPHLQDTITNDQAVSIVESLPAKWRVFVSILGTRHNILGLLKAGPAFDFLLYPDEAPDPAAEIQVPHRAIESAFEQPLRPTALLRGIRAAAKSKVFLLSTPPPKQSNAFMLERFMQQGNKAYRGRSVEEVGIERPETRLKLWRMEVRALEKWAVSQGMKVLPPPAEAFDEDGFLAPRYYSDATHANADYGALVVDQMRAIVERTRTKAANG